MCPGQARYWDLPTKLYSYRSVEKLQLPRSFHHPFSRQPRTPLSMRPEQIWKWNLAVKLCSYSDVYVSFHGNRGPRQARQAGIWVALLPVQAGPERPAVAAWSKAYAPDVHVLPLSGQLLSGRRPNAPFGALRSALAVDPACSVSIGHLVLQEAKQARVEDEGEGDESALESVENDIDPPEGSHFRKGGQEAGGPGEAHDAHHLAVDHQSLLVRILLACCTTRNRSCHATCYIRGGMHVGVTNGVHAGRRGRGERMGGRGRRHGRKREECGKDVKQIFF